MDTAVASHRALILGMGNTLVGDDGVGIYAARAVQKILGDSAPDVHVRETALAGPALVTLLSGYDHVVVVDAAATAPSEPGRVHVLDLEQLAPTRHTISPHSLNLYTAVELGRRCGLPMPAKVDVVVVEILEATDVREQCTPAVERAIRPAAQAALRCLREFLPDHVFPDT